MYSNLMCSSCKEIYLEKCVFSVNNSFIAKFRFSEFWIIWIYGCHLFSIIWISSNVGFDISLTFFHYSFNKCKICLMNRSFGNLKLERMHRFIIFGNDNESTCILIETMDDTRTFHTIDNRWIESIIIIPDA